MQNPMRRQIRLDGRWLVRSIDGQQVSVFVPGSWGERRVVLKPAKADSWSGVQAGQQPLVQDEIEHTWPAGDALAPGQWNTVTTEGGTVAGGKLEAGAHLHIAGLQASMAGQQSLAVRVRLAGNQAAEAQPREGAGLGGLLTLELTLTAGNGRLVGSTELVLGRKARELSVELPLPSPIRGAHRLKAVLCAGEQIIDNARIDFQA